jgi:hypothetical protein
MGNPHIQLANIMLPTAVYRCQLTQLNDILNPAIIQQNSQWKIRSAGLFYGELQLGQEKVHCPNKATYYTECAS